MRARALILVVLLLSYGAVGARQPAVRMSVPLPLPAQQIADALELSTIDRGQFVLKIVRSLFSVWLNEGDPTRGARFREMVSAAGSLRGETVPLPLDASIWRETILQRPVPDTDLIAAILSERNTALLYHGLAGLDDDTLAWLGPERDTLQHLLRHAGAFAIFGPSLRVRSGRIVVPGGERADVIWTALVGADPAKPAAFVRKLFGDEHGYVAWFYDTISQLDEPRLRFALGERLPASAQLDRARALLDLFKNSGIEWHPEVQPFSRRALDPGLTLSLVNVTPDGRLIGPASRGFWERTFSDGARFGSMSARALEESDPAPADAAWLLARIHRVPIDVGRKRLETFLFCQRMFPDIDRADVTIAEVLRAHAEFPALMLTLERMGLRSPATLHAAAVRAKALKEVGNGARQRTAILQFQTVVGLIDRMSRSGGVTVQRADELIAGLAALETNSKGYEGRIAAWLASTLVSALRPAENETGDAVEDAVVAAMAGVDSKARANTVDWEGRAYRVSASLSEAARIRRIRQRQGGPTLGAARASVADDSAQGKDVDKAEAVLADTLTSLLYAAYLGDPEGPAVLSGNAALRHQLETYGVVGNRGAWNLPWETQGAGGWRVSGSVMGLDVALARMALRRLDANEMPEEPRLVSSERQTASVTAAFLNPATLTDATRDEIAAALGRGRARLAALDGSRGELERLAADAGLSAWRREALAWTLEHDREHLPDQVSLVEMMWLGQPRSSPALSLDGWGAAMVPLTGCMCLRMPPAQPWELLRGRPALGLLATRGADVAILIADALAALNLPAELAPGVIAFAMQDVIDRAQPAHFDDWSAFSRATLSISRDSITDYIAAQTAGGALLPVRAADDRRP